ncbi:hypothetical protein BST93_10240 [Nonlabens tegetincola]|nr:hypothetical protein BST93_10240 [Nonlabens tegetincola]
MIFSSYSSDDNSNINSGSIIGTWKPIKEVNVCSTGSEIVYDFDSCIQTGRLIFFNNGTVSDTGYKLQNGNCEQYYHETGTWSLNGNNLTAKIEGDTNNPTFFELTNNTLRIGYYDADPNELCDGENLRSYYYDEFVRVE